MHGLIFERFLNPERMSMPDFDIDFDDRRRPEVIRYVTEKYGDDRVAMIVTYGTIKAKQAIKDAGRVLDYPFAMGDRITKAMPPAVMGKDVPLSGIFDPQHKRYSEAGEFRQLYEADADVRKIVDTARGLENLKRQWGVHAAGVIMSSEPLIELIPIMRRDQDGQIITQFDYPSCETLGLVKMDFLGLRNLTIMDDAVKNVEASRGITLDLDALAKTWTTRPTFELLGRGDTLGVFQFDGGPMRALLRLMKPDNFEDISAVGALYRPGPMGANSHTNYALRKNKQQEISYPHDELAVALEPILGTTYGLIVYQEQVMAIAQQLAGYTLGKADLLRRAMGKKKREVLDAEYVGFSEGMKANGFSDAVDQGAVGRPGPVLRLRVQQGALGGVRAGLVLDRLPEGELPRGVHGRCSDVREGRQGQDGHLPERVPPDGHQGAAAGRERVRLELHPGRYRHPLRPVRDPQRRRQRGGRDRRRPRVRGPVHRLRRLHRQGAAAGLQQARHRVAGQGRFVRLDEPRAARGRRGARAGRRRGDRPQAERGARPVRPVQRRRQFDLFSMGDDADEGEGNSRLTVTVPEIEEWDKATKLAHERDMLGLYVSDHPLFGVEHVLTNGTDCTIGQLLADEDRPDGTQVTIGGLVTAVQRKVNKRGDIYAIVTIEDLEGSIEVMMFSSAYQLAAHLLTNDAIILMKGRLRRRDDRVELSGSDVSVPDLTQGPSGPVVITMPINRCTPPVVDQLRDVLKSHPGMTEVQLRLQASQKTTVMRIGDRFRVTPTSSLMADLKALLGPSCLAS